MSKHFRVLPALLSALVALVAVPAPSFAAVRTTTAARTPMAQTVTAARLFGRRPSYTTPRYRGTTRSPYSRTYRRSPFHGIGGAILRGLGVAYLFHMLFGIGAGGGSPFGLIILVALIAFLLGRARSRQRRWSY